MDLDKKVKHGRERIAQEVEVTPPSIPGEKSEQLLVLEEKIKKLLEQVEALGESGKMDEAEALMRKVDVLNTEKVALTNQSGDKVLMLTQEQKMTLCETCSSFLVANDVVERTQSHVIVKQHIGHGMVEINILGMGWYETSLTSSRCRRKRQGKKRDLLGRRKTKKGESEGKRNLKLRIGTMIMNVSEALSGDAIMKGLEIVVGKGPGKDVDNRSLS